MNSLHCCAGRDIGCESRNAVRDFNGDGANVFPLQIAAGTLAQGGAPGLVLVSDAPIFYTVLRNTSK
jgi:hypothetical protein